MTMLGMRGLKGAPKNVRSKMETMLITTAAVAAWEKPVFQRPITVNAKVMAAAEELKANGGFISGVITIGLCGVRTYICDGQHRLEAFKISQLTEAIADVRLCNFDTMAEMSEEFTRLQLSLVKMTPDDILRGLEACHGPIAYLKRKCPFVGYDRVRKSANAPILSMSVALRAWAASDTEVPGAGGKSVVDLAKALTEDDAENMAEFLTLAYTAWGNDDEYKIVWRTLNLTLTMWLYRRTVITQYSPNTVKLTKAQFHECMMDVTAHEKFLSWLVNRSLGEVNRSPCYNRIREIFVARLQKDLGNTKKVRFPAPSWAHWSKPAGLTRQ